MENFIFCAVWLLFKLVYDSSYGQSEAIWDKTLGSKQVSQTSLLYYWKFQVKADRRWGHKFLD